MKRKKFNIFINASREKVWNVLWHPETYPEWTAPFCEGSSVETDWKEGSKVRFLGPGGYGMLSKIKKNSPFHLMHIEHIGVIGNGEEHTGNETAEKWKGAIENYRLEEGDVTELTNVKEKTELIVETDIDEEYLESFEKAWPKALQLIKELSESK